MRRRLATTVGLAAVLVLAISGPVWALQSAGPRLISPYLSVAVEAGKTATFEFDLEALSGSVVDLAVDQAPEGWATRIRGGAFLVDQVMVGDDGTEHLKLEVDVPATAPDGAYPIVLVARSTSGSDQLVFDLGVSEAASGGVSLSTEFPELKGPSDTNFSYTLDLANDTGAEITFGLETEGPSGWQITARPSGETQAATVTVPSGESKRVTVEVDPPDITEAGAYQVLVTASGDGESASAQLGVEITGKYDLSLITPDQRLNVDVEAGNVTEMPLTIINGGTAPLLGIGLSATPPHGWDVAFSPESVDDVEPGTAVPVTAIITPAADAINGDYSLAFTARTKEASDNIDVRATVKTSTIWGLVGIGAIVLTLVGLGVVFRVFGRR
jgi:uncharacterized membrane protein